MDRPQRCSRGCFCHLVSDRDTGELMEFARSIGLKESWLQKRGKYDEHFDLFNTYIDRAVRAGARVIERRALVKILRAKRDDLKRIA